MFAATHRSSQRPTRSNCPMVRRNPHHGRCMVCCLKKQRRYCTEGCQRGGGDNQDEVRGSSPSRNSFSETETWCRAGEKCGPLHVHAKARLHVFGLCVTEMRALCRLCHARVAQLPGGHHQVVGTTKQMLACPVSGQTVPVK